MSAEILSGDEFLDLCREDATIAADVYDALLADRDRLAARLAEVERERDEARRRCDEYVALRGWCGFENREGHIALVHGEEALMLAARSAAEPFAVYRRMGDLAASAPGGES